MSTGDAGVVAAGDALGEATPPEPSDAIAAVVAQPRSRYHENCISQIFVSDRKLLLVLDAVKLL